MINTVQRGKKKNKTHSTRIVSSSKYTWASNSHQIQHFLFCKQYFIKSLWDRKLRMNDPKSILKPSITQMWSFFRNEKLRKVK